MLQSAVLEVGLKNAHKDPIHDMGMGRRKLSLKIFCTEEEGYTLLKLGVPFCIFFCTAVMIMGLFVLGICRCFRNVGTFPVHPGKLRGFFFQDNLQMRSLGF